MLVTLWATFPISPAMAGAAEEEVFGLFEWFCLAHLSKPHQASFLLEGLGAKALPDDKAKMFLYPKKGKAWLLPGKHTSFMVGQTTDNVCTVYGKDALGFQTQQVFEKNVNCLSG